MVARSVAVYITGDSKSLDDALAGSAAKADATADAIGDSFNGATSKTGNAFEKLGQKLENWGIPFGSSISKVGEKFDEADTKGQKFGQAMSTLGGAVLAAGAVGLVAFGAESIEMADKFDVAQANLKVAVDATGANFQKLKPKIDDTYKSMSSLGFNSIDTANALATLTTSAGSPTKALDLMGQAADLARFKHISLASASQLLAKVMAGSNRVITQMGLNLDIGTGKLASIQTASEGVTKAQLALKNTEEGIADGSTKAAQAGTALATAHENLSIAEQKLSMDQHAVGDVLDALAKKTRGAAAAYGQTLAGQMDVAKAKLENLSVAFGERLIPILEDAGKAVAKVIDWFEKHKAVAEGLAVVIGAVLGAAVLKFAVETAGKMVGGARNMANSLLHLGDTFKASAGAADADKDAQSLLAEKTDLLSQQVKLLSAQLNLQKQAAQGSTDATVEATQASLDDAKGKLKQAEAAQRAAAANQKLADTDEEVSESNAQLTASLAEVDAQLDTVSAGMGEVAESAPEVDAAFEATGAAADSAFGPIGLIIMGVVTVGTLLVTHWKQVEEVLKDVWGGIKTAAVAVWHAVEDAVKTAVNVLVTIFEDFTPEGILIKHWNTVKSDAIKVWHDIVSFIEGIPGDIVSALESLGSDIENVARDAWNDFKQAVIAGWNAEVSFWESIPGKVLAALGDAGSVLLSWGEGLIHGIVAGIESAAADVGKALLAVIKGSMSTIHNAVASLPVIGGALASVIPAAKGGYVNSPTLILAGEAGPEFIIPEEQLRQQYAAGLKPLSQTLPSASSTGFGTTVGGTNTASSGNSQVINIQAITNATPEEIAREVGWALRTASLS